MQQEHSTHQLRASRFLEPPGPTLPPPPPSFLLLLHLTSRVQPRTRNQKLSFRSQVTYTWNLATPGSFGPALLFLQKLMSVIRNVSWPLSGWFSGHGMPSLLQSPGRREGVGKSMSGGTIGSTLSMGLAATTTTLVGGTAGSGGTGSGQHVHHPGNRVSGGTRLLSLPCVFCCSTDSGIHFSRSLSSNLEKQK